MSQIDGSRQIKAGSITNDRLATPPSASQSWDLDWSKDGSTYTGFTTGSGSWSSSGSYISCTAPTSGNFARAAISSAPWSAFGLTLLKWEMYIPSGQSLSGSSGMVMFTSSGAGNGQPIFRLDNSTTTGSQATIEQDGTAGITSKSLTFALDTWLTCHMLNVAGKITGYVAGVPVVSHYAALTTPASNTNIYPALVSYQQAARFRNIKGYRLGGLP